VKWRTNIIETIMDSDNILIRDCSPQNYDHEQEEMYTQFLWENIKDGERLKDVLGGRIILIWDMML
jgi:hypothetical protein